MSRLPGSPPTNHPAVLQALPEVRQLAREMAKAYRVRTRHGVEDAQQTACQALLEAYPTFDPTRGTPLSVYAWKRIVGSLLVLFGQEASAGATGRRAALDEAESMRDADDDAFDDGDADAFGQLKGFCRVFTFARFLGDMREHGLARPDDALARARALEAVRVALGGFDAVEARLLELRYWQDLSWSKVGAELGMDEKQAQRLDLKLRERLRRELRRQGMRDASPVREP